MSQLFILTSNYQKSDNDKIYLRLPDSRCDFLCLVCVILLMEVAIFLKKSLHKNIQYIFKIHPHAQFANDTI